VFCLYLSVHNEGRGPSETRTSAFTEQSDVIDCTLDLCLNRPVLKVPLWSAQRPALLTEVSLDFPKHLLQADARIVSQSRHRLLTSTFVSNSLFTNHSIFQAV
jgi:hypothetical protein